jgi:curved DNA-binding protein CbpA
MRVSEARDVLGLGPDATPEDARKAYKRLALQHHPDKAGNSPEATANFQKIQDAYTTLQRADEVGRHYDDDGYSEDDDDYFDDDLYGDDDFGDIPFFFAQMFGARAGFPGFGPFGSADFGRYRHGESCDCPQCVYERQQFFADQRDTEWEQRQREREQRAHEARRRQAAEERQRAKREFADARARAQRESTSSSAGASSNTKAEQLRQRGNRAFREGKFARAAAQYTAALHELGSGAADATILSNRSLAYSKLDRFDAALDDADACLALKADWDRAHARRAVALGGLAKHEEAALAFERASELVRGRSEAEYRGYVDMAAAQRELREQKTRDEEQRRSDALEAEARRVQQQKEREAREEQTRAEVTAELRVAVERRDARAVERCLETAQRLRVDKQEVKAAKAMLREAARAEEAAARAAEEDEQAEKCVGALSAVLDGGTMPTRSALKSAIRQAEACGVGDRPVGSTGERLLSRARQRLLEIASASKKEQERVRAAEQEALAAAAERDRVARQARAQEEVEAARKAAEEVSAREEAAASRAAAEAAWRHERERAESMERERLLHLQREEEAAWRRVAEEATARSRRRGGRRRWHGLQGRGRCCCGR